MAEKYVDADPRILRAIAHPLRAALLYELYARGSATATDLAESVGQPVNSVSFHLRQLAKYGLIEDDPDATGSDGRQRWWRPAMSEGVVVSDEKLSQTPEGRAGLDVFRRNVVAKMQALIERFFTPREDTGEVWASNDVPMLLTDDEARACNTEVLEVLRKWHEHGQRAGREGDEERRTYLAISMVMPHQTDLVD
jgi:DNA-binding transcriptional ArsR family regulator